MNQTLIQIFFDSQCDVTQGHIIDSTLRGWVSRQIGFAATRLRVRAGEAYRGLMPTAKQYRRSSAMSNLHLSRQFASTGMSKSWPRRALTQRAAELRYMYKIIHNQIGTVK